MTGKWKIEVFRDQGQYRWKLINRVGDVVMTSRERHPTKAAAFMAAEYELNEIRQAIVVG